jgi:predicted nucleic acid-binding Zn ribbon protein
MGSLNRICPKCGVPLSPSEMFCSNCDTRFTEQTVTGPTRSAPLPTLGSSIPDQLSSIEPAPSDSFNYGNASEYTAPGYSSTLSMLTEPNNAQETSGEQSPTQPFPGDFVQVPRRRKKPNIVLVVGVVALLLLVIGGSIFFFVKSTGSNSHGASNDTLAFITNGAKPLFSDNFADNTRGWGLASASGYSSTISNNTMTLADANHKILDMAIPASNNVSATYSDFVVTTTFTLLKADQNDSVGLYVRGDNSLSQGYFIDIFGDNSFDIVKIFANSNKDTFLVSPTNSSSINPVGRQNILTVIVKGPKIVVLINNKVVSSISDNNGYTSGTIELFVENGQSSNGAQASFSHVTVYPAPDHLPS